MACVVTTVSISPLVSALNEDSGTLCSCVSSGDTSHANSLAVLCKIGHAKKKNKLCSECIRYKSD